MKSLHLTMMIFFQVLLASAVLYLTPFASASPLIDHHEPHKVDLIAPSASVPHQQAPIVEPAKPVVAVQHPASPIVQQAHIKPESAIVERNSDATESQVAPEVSKVVKDVPVKAELPKFASPIVEPQVVGKKVVDSEVVKATKPEEAADLKAKSAVSDKATPEKMVASPVVVDKKPEAEPANLKAKSAEVDTKPAVQVVASPIVPEIPVKPAKASPQPVVVAAPVEQQPPQAAALVAPAVVARPSSQVYSAATPAVVKGGLGPLHLLASTLCSYQPDRLVADDCLNQLYARRAVLRKSLFEFMSLKFTNLEKLSSRLGSGLQVVPVKSVDATTTGVNSRGVAGGPAPTPSHGWPVVGKCTAHDLKLMGEAAWCENEQPPSTSQEQQQPPTATKEELEAAAAKIASNRHLGRAQSARSIGEQSGSSLAFLPSPEQSSVISKLLHVTDIKDAPLVESSIYNLNLTQQQLATLEAHATSTRECRRNALRYTKALFNHLAEDQKATSDSWPQLYALISADDCARKRMIDIITALSGFRTDVTSIRRDNLEFAFAMDDLRTKVLENEINVALTFDKQFIEVEQFLQQSVQLMLSNIDPNRAKITSMRYRSLMYGTTGNSDDQCIELHQRLLAQNYPTDCNPTQFGQLPDVLRMTASSLELWSIEKEISLHTSRGVVDYPNSNQTGQQKFKEDVNECIANLVAS